MAIPDLLRSRLVQASAGGALALATVLITNFEGLKHYPYFDTGNIATVCYGHTGPDIIWGRYYSTEECDAFLIKDRRRGEIAVARNVKVPIPETLRGALISFAYNVGEGQFKRSTLLSRLNARNYAGACQQLKLWIYDNGKKFSGLINRRAAEQWVCEGMQ